MDNNKVVQKMENKMHIRVTYKDGSEASIHLQGTITVTEGPELNTLHTEDCDHYFNTSDGTYDGWGVKIKEEKHIDEISDDLHRIYLDK